MVEAAPLVTILEARIPPGGAAEWVEGAGGVRLRAALFPAVGAPRGSVVLSGGRTEPIEKYFEVIGELQERGFAVLAHDWRGQGLSQRLLADRLRGHAQGFEAFLDDYRALLAAYEARLPKPWIALGHSMGGCLTLLALARGEARRFAAGALSAPMLGLKLPLPLSVTRAMAGIFNALGRRDGYVFLQKGSPFEDAFEDNHLTHDERRYLRHRRQIAACRDLALGNVTWGWLDFALKAMAEVADPRRLAAVTLPMLVVSAEGDQIVEVAAQARAARALPDARYVVVPGARHELLMETDERRAVFWAAFDALADRAAPRRG
jgi:lysophospholipase